MLISEELCPSRETTDVSVLVCVCILRARTPWLVTLVVTVFASMWYGSFLFTLPTVPNPPGSHSRRRRETVTAVVENHWDCETRHSECEKRSAEYGCSSED